jgi:hypothetical protein
VPIIADNPGMRNKWLFAAVLILLWGCSSAPDAPTTKLGSETVRVQPKGKTDPFGLPIVIVLDPPPVPKEIERPSPPIKESPAEPAPKKKSIWPLDFGS